MGDGAWPGTFPWNSGVGEGSARAHACKYGPGAYLYSSVASIKRHITQRRTVDHCQGGGGVGGLGASKKNLKPTAHVSDTVPLSLGAYGVGQLLHGAGDYSALIWPGLLRLQVAVDIGSQFLKVSAEQSVRGATRASAGDHAQRTPATLRVP